MAKTESETKKIDGISKKAEKSANCGLVMPISAMDGCPAEHWLEVKSIITEAVEASENPKFAVKLVSDADDIGVIQKRIIQNIYANDIIICDVSGKNPNVMFELGMRLAFDKPVVIVKDDKTEYSFDTGIIEHITYPRDLRFSRIVDFKKTLLTKAIATYEMSIAKPDQSPFLKNFGKFTVANLDETTVTPDRLLLELMEETRSEIRRLQRRFDSAEFSSRRRPPSGEFIARLSSFIPKYIEQEKISDTKNLLGNSEFYRYIEKSLDAPRYFDSSSEFEKTLEMVLLDYLRSRE